jgi:hypothetical protein
MNKLIPSWLAALSGILTGRSLNKCGLGRAAHSTHRRQNDADDLAGRCYLW